MNKLTRREVVATTLGAGLAFGVGCRSTGGKYGSTGDCLRKEAMYKEGKLDIAAVKKAYFDMFERFNYPVPDVLHTDQFWVADFLQGDILKLGMGGIFWINDKGIYKEHGAKQYKGEFADEKFGYLGHDIYLLPGQTLPEHHHIGGSEGYGPKMESWQVRYGEVTFYGEYKGEGSEMPLNALPIAKRPWGFGEPWMKSKYGITLSANSGNVIYTLKDPESWHGQVAGPQGAIVTEYATYHNHVTFSKPGMEFACTGHV